MAVVFVVALPTLAKASDRFVETKSVVSAEFVKISDTEAKIILTMQEKWHTNANKVTMDFLIPTEVTGLQKTISYPAGEMLDTPLGEISVYSDKTTIHLPLTPRDKILKLTAQACNGATCYPPSEWIFEAK